MFYDLCLRPDNIEKAIEFARKLGWEGIGLLFNDLRQAEEAKKNIQKNIDVTPGIMIKTDKTGEMQKMVKQNRMKSELIVVEGVSEEINRAALETEEVDILIMDPKAETGFNHIMARLAQKNNVAVCFSFQDLLHSNKKMRADVFHRYLEIAKLCRKFRSPFVVSSCAQSEWDLRSPSDLLSFGRLLGFSDPQIKNAMSDGIVRENRKRLSGKWAMPGVELG
ncbi:MAG: hypothetical protein HY518_05160, partial [Candidatus Aenigmarchaeota archaeon]|nr:hypothetical protein [Candidatus Aenigmarchaeota archaeon]